MASSRLFLAMLASMLLTSACAFEAVDTDPALKVGNSYYTALQRGDAAASEQLYSRQFKSSVPQWLPFIRKYQEKFGAVASFSPGEIHVVPADNGPCYWIAYEIHRPGVDSEDHLLVCREHDGKRWSIAGHSTVRKDTGQSVSAGTIPQEVGVRIGSP